MTLATLLKFAAYNTVCVLGTWVYAWHCGYRAGRGRWWKPGDDR